MAMAEAGRPSVLVVNDDPTQLRLAVAVLEKDGMSTTACTGAEEALEVLRSGAVVDVIVTDLHMPGIDGWRLCRLLRSPEYARFNRIPILVVSATFSGADAEQVTVDVGANAFLPIPYQPSELRSHVRALLEGRTPKALPRVLVVEDHATGAALLGRAFREHGYMVFTAKNGAEALRALKEHRPDIVVIDYHLPDMPGDQLLPACKDPTSPAAAVMITGNPDPELALRFMRMGADAYVRKPFDAEYLIELCEKARRERAMIRVEAILEQRTQQLRQSEAVFRALSETTSAGIIVFRGERFCYANRAAQEITGYTPEELQDMRFWELVHPDHRDLVRTRGFARLRGEKVPERYEFKILRKDGSTRWIDTAAARTVWEGTTAVLATIFDITERKEAEQALIESERRFSEVFENASDLIYTHDLEGNILTFNKAGEVITGYDRREAAGMNIRQLVAPEYVDLVRDMVRRKLEGEVARTTYEIELVTKSGGRVTVEVSSQLLHRSGEPVIVEGIARDVTERKRMEAERARLVLAIESAADAIVITDADANIQYVNPAFERMTGYSLNEVKGKNPRLLKSGRHGPEFYRDMWDTITRGDVWTGRITNKRKDGSLYLERCTISSVRDQSGKVLNYVAVKRDITERVALEEKLRQSQKMEAVGRLAGGVAHDFNNLLTAISGYSDLLARKMDSDDPAAAYVREIRKAADRASALTNQLLAFSRRQVMAPKVINLNTTVRDMAEMLGRLIGEHIELVTVLGENLWCVKADPSQIEQVVMNLVVNARDAMPEGGKLTIETANVYLDREYAQYHSPVQPGRYVMLAISDNGCGMDAETLSHVFEPFYTTKERGKGTGLGLATVYGIVKQSGGYIWVYSEPGMGTTFRIYLPPADEEGEVPEAVSAPSQNLSGDETVLLVEDEDAVRSLLKNVLASYGYTVLDAANGNEAVRLAEQHEGPIHVLVTDVVMPGMSGRALAETLTQKRPDMKVVYMSGYTDDAIVHHGVLEEGVEFLQKPFALEAVAAKIRGVMASRGS